MIVQDRLTPVDRDTAAAALMTAYWRITGVLPSDKVAALLLAQSALETGHWKSIHNFNFGNIKAGPNYPSIAQFRCSEVENGAEIFYDPPDPHCNFRAYDTAADGAVDYLKVLQSRPHWWKGLHTENPSAFVDQLATPPKYFTADPARYKATLTSLYEQFLPLVRAASIQMRRLQSTRVQTSAPAPTSVLVSKPATPVHSASCSGSSLSPGRSFSARCTDHSDALDGTTATIGTSEENPPAPATPTSADTALASSSWISVVRAVLRWLSKLLRADGGTP